MTPKDATIATRLIMALFLVQPMAFGAWLGMIPYVKDALALTKADLAVALLGMPVALLFTLQSASKIVERIGARHSFIYVLPLQSCALLLPFAAQGVVTLFVALAIAGSCIAFLEVALNTYAGRLEKASGRLIMSRCHGFWALGVGLGSFLAARLAGFTPAVAVCMVAVVSAAVGMVCATKLVRLTQTVTTDRPPRQKLRDMPKPLFLIAGFVFFITLVEGAMSDWAAVYLAERWGGAVTEAGIAVSIFAGFLAVGRFCGDWLKARLGAKGVAQLTAGCAAAGVLVLTVPSPIPCVLIGLAMIGLGVSVGFPLGISAAAALDDHHEAQNIATTSMLGMSAFLIGPPMIGFIAELFSLRLALLTLIPGLVVSFFLSRILFRPGSSKPCFGRFVCFVFCDSSVVHVIFVWIRVCWLG